MLDYILKCFKVFASVNNLLNILTFEKKIFKSKTVGMGWSCLASEQRPYT